jgi:PLP dependent protein
MTEALLARRAELAANLAHVRAELAAACVRAGRPADAARLIVVSKFKPASDIRLAYELGERDFGENYVQELLVKQAELQDLVDLRWHLIGHLQRNKVQKLAGVPLTLHTLDGERLARELQQRWQGRRSEVFIEVNLAREAQKAGCLPEQLPQVLTELAQYSALRVVGLMAIPPAAATGDLVRPYFQQLRTLGEQAGLPRLSMGMSQDFALAIEEGATEVRVGSAIFGAR